jgi:hypothetical protein
VERTITIEELLVANEALETASSRNVDPTLALLMAAAAAASHAHLPLEEFQALAAEAFAHVTKLEDETDPG